MTNKCPTCLEPLVSDSKNYIVTTPCGHLFHTNCVRGWIDRGNKTCPQCRSNISKNKLIRIYLQSTESDIQIPHKTVTNSTIAPSNPETTQTRCNICKYDFGNKGYLMRHLKSKIHLDKANLVISGFESSNAAVQYIRPNDFANDGNRQDSENAPQNLSSNSVSNSREANYVSLNSQTNSARTVNEVSSSRTTRTNPTTTAATYQDGCTMHNDKVCCSVFTFCVFLFIALCFVGSYFTSKAEKKKWLNEKNSVSLIIYY